MISLFVPGDPKTKGSTKSFAPRYGDGSLVRRANGSIVINTTNDCKKAKGWQRAISAAVRPLAPKQPWDGPVRLDVTFFLRRPKTVKRELPHVRSDLDKMLRVVMDALTGIIYRDDGQVVSGEIGKRYGEPGVEIIASRLDGVAAIALAGRRMAMGVK